MISPLLWQSLSWNDSTAWADFLGQHQSAHRELAKLTKTAYQGLDDLRVELAPHAKIHNELAGFAGLPVVSDLVGYDLEDEASFYGFIAVHALDHVRLAAAVGLV